ncbi:MAG: undecaprenyl-diphosphate phosphatase [Deltaproteobacteria bacterium]|nr:undecaprenyl-diphosphate phosphatase [Deltaproteobacteria bacterium]
MDYIYITILGAVQGATEFLPVSSSGHLAAGKLFFNLKAFDQAPLLLEIILHLATLLAVVIVYRKDVLGLVEGFFSIAKSSVTNNLVTTVKDDKNARLLFLLFMASLPTAIIGIAMEKSGIAQAVSENHIFLGISFLSCSAILFAGRFENLNKKDLSLKLALIIGLAQGIAVMPGISRSGTTIIVALLLGIKREEAAKFSFLLSVPAILGAALLDLNPAALSDTGETGAVLSGFAAAFIVGTLSLVLLIKLVKNGRLWLFSPYVAAMGTMVLLFL